MQGSQPALLLQTSILDMVSHGSVYTYAVLAILACFSILSLTIIFSKWAAFSSASGTDARFVRAFRKSNSLEAVTGGGGELPAHSARRRFSDYGYAEAAPPIECAPAGSSIKTRFRAVCRVGISEQLSRFEQQSELAGDDCVGFAVYRAVRNSDGDCARFPKPGLG